MKLSNSVRKRFCKDFSLPIGILDDEYFDYYIEQYDSLLNTKYKLNLLEDTIKTLGNEEAFMKEFNRIKDAIIHDISSTEGYSNLSNDLNPRIYNTKYIHHRQNIYSPQFDGKSIISIDLVKANFFALKMYDKNIVNDMSTWSQFLSQYTDIEYYHISKQLRQVIFGNLLPKKQQNIQKAVCNEIADTIKKYNSELDVATVSTDEILILNHPNALSGIKEIQDLIFSKLKYTVDDLKIEAFKLNKLHPQKSYFAKECLVSNNVTFKSVPQIFYAQVFKQYFGLNISDYDMSFFHEGYIAKFNKSIYEV